MDIYDKIYDFCKVRNNGGAHKNGNTPSPRVLFLMNLLDSMNIEYYLDVYQTSRFGENNFYNIEMKGTSDKMVVAHHDIVNSLTDNANDNSCSVINAIMVKKLRPDVNVVLLDGEEPPMMGVGSQRCSERINQGIFGNISWVLNFELTGKGGENFFIGNYPGKLFDHVLEIFNCPVFNTPFNDADIFRKNGIDSIVINPLPETDEKTPIKTTTGKYLDYKLLFNCHSPKDTLSTIDPNDMQIFVEKIVLKILY